MASADERKGELRKRMRAERAALSKEDRAAVDARICERACAADQYRAAEVVLPYLSMGSEVETRGIIERAWADGKIVALPRCTGPREMRWFKVRDLSNLERSPIGVDEPAFDQSAEQLLCTGQIMVAFVPGLAFDAKGYRLGYGGGFYDAFLSAFDGSSIGLCRRAQFVGDLSAYGAVDVHDLPVELVISE